MYMHFIHGLAMDNSLQTSSIYGQTNPNRLISHNLMFTHLNPHLSLFHKIEAHKYEKDFCKSKYYLINENYKFPKKIINLTYK